MKLNDIKDNIGARKQVSALAAALAPVKAKPQVLVIKAKRRVQV